MNEVRSINVICFDDNSCLLESIALLLSTTGNLKLIGAYNSYHNLIEIVSEKKPDVILMDIDILPLNGIDAVRQLRLHFPDVAVLMLTGFEDDDKVFASLCAEANGYLLKNAQMDMLIHQIQEVNEGGAPMTPIIARRVLTQFAKVHPQVEADSNYNLSKREIDVLQLLVQGKSYKMIADTLHLSYETVHSHIRKIYKKLQVNSVGEAVSKTISKNILRVFAF